MTKATHLSDDIFVRPPLKQTLKAWKPFWDCVDVLFIFQNSDIDETHTEWKFFWIAGIALLRTVGHVLAKSDALTSAEHKVEIDQLWAEWKSAPKVNDIFWDFIEEERNNILKTYVFGAKMIKIEEEFYVMYNDEINAYNLFRKAIYWWRCQLERLEDRLP